MGQFFCLNGMMEQVVIEGPYDAQLVRNGTSKDLVVVFSHSQRHALKRYPYEQSVLFIKETRQRYFLVSAGIACRSLVREIRRFGFQRTIFIGTSKGGFAALLWAALCAKSDRANAYRALAFSPQTSLWPKNENLYFPSYHALLSNTQHKGAMSGLKKYGDLRFIGGIRNLDVTIVYGGDNTVDAIEAERITGGNIELLRLPFGIHGSMTPFVHDRSNRQAVATLADKIYKTAETDDDLRVSLPPEKSEFIDSIMNFDGSSSLNDLIAERLARSTDPGRVLRLFQWLRSFS